MKKKIISVLTKLLMAAVAIYILVQLADLQTGIRAAQVQEQELHQQVTYAEQEHRQLDQQINELGSDESTVKIARERLGMVAEGEIVFYDSDD